MPLRNSVEPIVLYSSVLLGLICAIFYCAFESVPLNYSGIYQFDTGGQTFSFLILRFFGHIASNFCLAYLIYWFGPRLLRKAQQGIIDPEDRQLFLPLSARPLSF